MNTAIFAGNVGQDPRINTVQGQQGATSVLNFSLAVQKRQKGQDGKYLTLWVSCSLWGQRADALAPFIKKGSKLTVQGEIDVETYVANDQTVQPKLMLRVNEVTLQGSPGDQQQQQRPPAQQPRTGYNTNGSAAPNTYAGNGPHGGFNQPQQGAFNQPQGQQQPPIDFDDDIPF